jgi:hypothetical protein
LRPFVQRLMPSVMPLLCSKTPPKPFPGSAARENSK